MKVYEGYKLRGPYVRKDGRAYLSAITPDGKRTTISYPKYLVEVALGRYLKPNEVVHHKNENPLDNRLENLEVLDRSMHTKLHSKRLAPQTFVCPVCGKDFMLEGRKLHDAITNRKKEKVGPFCSKRCAGKYGSLLQHKKINKLGISKIIPQYTRYSDDLLLE